MIKYRYFPILKRTVITSVNYGTNPNPNHVNHAQSGKSNFEKDFEKTHLTTTPLQKVLLGLGSGIVSISDPSRGDMIAVMGETTGGTSLDHVHYKMLQSDEGRRILEEKPRINSSTVDLEKLKSMPEGTLGKAYSNFLEKYNYTPDTRMAVRFVDDVELAYVIQRYREVHDLFHTLLDMPTNMLGEVTVKWVEAIQTRLPMCVTGALFGPLRLAPKFTRMYSTRQKPEVKFEPLVTEEIESQQYKPKKHPGVMNMPVLELPENIRNSVKLILDEEEDLAMLKKKAEKLHNILIHRHLPAEDSELEVRKQEITEEVMPKYEKKLQLSTSEEETLKIKKSMEKKIESLVISRTYQWKALKYDKILTYSYLIGRTPLEYNVLMKIFNEIVKRDKDFKPVTLFDFGSGIGTVSWVAHHFWNESLKEYMCVDSSHAMHDLALLILKNNNPKKKSFINTVYQKEFLPTAKMSYDLVVSAFSFMELPNFNTRMETFLNLWNKTEKYLVIVENGTNQGFRVINEIREYLMHLSEKKNIEYHIFAPCSHEQSCPRFYEQEETKTPCNFKIKFRSLLEKEDVRTGLYSYLVIKKGERSSEDPRWPRIVRNTLLRHKHVWCRLCTAEGKLEDLVVTKKKHGVAAYQCARKSNWGDLFPVEIVTPSAEEDTSESEEMNASECTESSETNESGSESEEVTEMTTECEKSSVTDEDASKH